MNQTLLKFNQDLKTIQRPTLKAGDFVNVHKRIKEGNKERVQVFKGMVIAIKGGQSSSPMITVRRESQGVGVEITFPLYLATIEKIEVLRHSKVRRAKLYYMRGRSGKAAKMKVKDLTAQEKQDFNGAKAKATEETKKEEGTPAEKKAEK